MQPSSHFQTKSHGLYKLANPTMPRGFIMSVSAGVTQTTRFGWPNPADPHSSLGSAASQDDWRRELPSATAESSADW